jgi:hypothetical protein
MLQSCCLLSQLVKGLLGPFCMLLVGRLQLSEAMHQLLMAAAEDTLQGSTQAVHATSCMQTPRHGMPC